MIGKIKVIATITPDLTLGENVQYELVNFNEFIDWALSQTEVQVDIETDVTERWNDKTLISIQFGSCRFGAERVQWFFQWSALTDDQKAFISWVLETPRILKLAHNAKFEYIVLRFYGIIVNNIYDTMLAEKVLRGGLENAEYALADISWKYLRIIMNKEEQSNFGDNIITPKKIKYGITDVAYLDVIKRLQYQEAQEKELLNVLGLEMAALPAFSDITYEGMRLDCDKWRDNIRLAEPVVAEALTKVNKWLEIEPFKSYALKNGHLSNEDRCVINYNSHPQKNELLQLLFPDIIGGTKVIVQSYIRDNAMQMPINRLMILEAYLRKDYVPLQQALLTEHRDYLITHDYLIPAGEPTLNWNSQPQVLPLAQLVEPKLKDLSEESINKTIHPMLRDREKYIDALKLISTYGEEFIRKHVNSDGKVRTNFNQVVSTGRVSTSNPNMQNIVVTEQVGTRYRNAFVCDPDYVFVDSDYTGQELGIIAYVSKDPVWLDAIINGFDLHSICAELVFGDKWKKAADSDCKYYKMEVGPDGKMRKAKQKCKCHKHSILRYQVKSINFGLAYGMSEFKLAGELQITIPEARTLIATYFTVFPKIKDTLEFMGDFGIQNGYIMTLAPFHRKRYFPYWYENKMYVEPHRLGIRFNPTLGEIERASKNMPIQGAGADMMKTAMVLIRNYIYEHDLQDLIKIVAQVHDQLTTICHKDHAEWWKDRMDELMREAARLIIPTGILKADTNITPCWTK